MASRKESKPLKLFSDPKKNSIELRNVNTHLKTFKRQTNIEIRLDDQEINPERLKRRKSIIMDNNDFIEEVNSFNGK